MPCKNPNCRSFGHVHPNCRCYADGGLVHFCSGGMAHSEECEHFADGGTVEDNQEILQNPALAVDHAAIDHGLHYHLTKSGHSKSDNPGKPIEHFVDHSKRGKKSLHHRIDSFFDKPEPIKPDPEKVGALKERIEDFKANPDHLLDIGGSIHSHFPDHGLALGVKTAAMMNYLSSIKPKGSQLSPLDEVTQPNKMAVAAYDRQVTIAEHPTLILQYVKEGTVLPQDLTTLRTLYPALAESMVSKMGESLINAKLHNKPLSYKTKMGLSAILGQPLDSTLSQPAMAAIIASQAGTQTQAQQQSNKRAGATEQTQKTIAKVADLYKDPIDKRLSSS